MNTYLNKKLKKVFSLCLVVFTVLITFVNTQAAQTDTDTENASLRKVRVGYLIYPGYQEGKEDEPKSGYGYEYLQQIAYYAGWEYEYVNGSFNELLQMLRDGDIDIMGDLSYTEDRAKDIDFANEEQGREYYYLFVREDRTDIQASDFSTLQNARVGINKGSIQVELFQEWCEKNNVECRVELYENSDERYADMNSGKLDAIVSTTVAEKELVKYHWNSILKIGYSPYYFAVSKKSEGLYVQLNDAIAKILQSDWYYNEKVYLKYNGKTSAASAGFTQEDRDWLEEKGNIKIGYTTDTLPYSDWSTSKNEMIGLLTTFTDHMQERYGANFVPVKYENYEDMAAALQRGEIDAVFPIYGSYWVAEENDMMVTEELVSSYLMMVYKNAYDKDTSSVIAVVQSSPLNRFAVLENYPEAKIVYYQTLEDCVNAVDSGEATCTLMCSDTYYAYRNELENLTNLNMTNTGYEVPISFAVRRDNVKLYNILKKGLASIQDKEIHEALIAEGYANPELNVRQFLQKHFFLVVIVLGVVLALVLTLIIYFIISVRKEGKLSKNNDELSEKAYIDIATGLPNKNKCEEMLSSHYVISKPTACFMLDLNDLKKVNDTLGHEMGDMMILNFAKLLRKVVPLHYFVGRFGGDEFIVIAENISGREEAEELVQNIKEIILKFNGLRGEFQISYACGYALSEDYPEIGLLELLNQADQNMYDDKVRSKKNRK